MTDSVPPLESSPAPSPDTPSGTPATPHEPGALTVTRRIGGGAMLRRRRPTQFTPARQRAFLEHLSQTANVSASAAAVGIDSAQAYKLRRREPEFAAEWRAALVNAYDEIEQELLNRALNGVDRPIVWQGRETGRVSGLDTTLMLRVMGIHREEVRAARAADFDLGAARQRLSERLDDLAERLRQPLPDGLSTHEHAADEGAGGAADGVAGGVVAEATPADGAVPKAGVGDREAERAEPPGAAPAAPPSPSGGGDPDAALSNAPTVPADTAPESGE